MKKLPSVSIIIPTLNRKKVLKEALLSLNGVDYPRERLEIVVVSDGSIDGTEKMVEEVKKSLNYKFKLIREKRKGISHAKNVAIQNSKGEIIISTDDDCMFEHRWLRKLVKPFENPHVGATGGPDNPYKRSSWFSVCAHYAFTSFVGSGGVHGQPLAIKLGRFCPMGCNMAIRRRVLQKIGLFDEKIAPGEETDLIYRLEKSGYQVVSVPEAFVWHRAIDNLGGFIRMIFRRGKARVIMVQRHGLVSDFIYFLPAMMVIILVGLVIVSLFSPLFWQVLIGLGLIYLLLLLSVGFSALFYYRKLYCLLVVPVLIFVQHFTHGIGFLAGVVSLYVHSGFK